MNLDVTPYTSEELWRVFHKESGSINKHLLIIYSLAIGVYAQRALDLGIGDTTRTLRAAMKVTGGKLFSCDFDRSRFAHLVDQGDEHWEFFLGSTEDFLRRVEPPLDFVIHDAAHDYWQVRWDLEHILPLMRRFGIVCVHDTQMPGIAEEMTRAVADAARGFAVSYVHLPFSSGLTILRVEESPHPDIASPWRNLRLGDTPGVACLPWPMQPSVADRARSLAAREWVLWMLRRAKRRLREVTR